MLLGLSNRGALHARSRERYPNDPQAPWNKGKLTGAKPALRPKHVWSIRTKLQIEGRVRDLAMFNLAIDSKLRGCDVVAIKVEDVAAGGYTADRATVRQKPTSLISHDMNVFPTACCTRNRAVAKHFGRKAT